MFARWASKIIKEATHREKGFTAWYTCSISTCSECAKECASLDELKWDMKVHQNISATTTASSTQHCYIRIDKSNVLRNFSIQCLIKGFYYSKMRMFSVQTGREQNVYLMRICRIEKSWSQLEVIREASSQKSIPRCNSADSLTPGIRKS